MLVKTLVVTPFQQNARLIIDETSSRAAVIDPGGDVDRIYRTIEAEKLDVESIILTHGHIDHAGGVQRLLDLLLENGLADVEFLAHAKEDLRKSINGQAVMFGLNPFDFPNPPAPDRTIDEGDEIVIGSLKAEVLFVPGHAPDHLAFYFPDVEFANAWVDEKGSMRESSGRSPLLIAGDTLFAGSIGRTDLPGGDYETLLSSIREKLLILPDETLVLSGHGLDTSVGVEKKTNPFILAG